MDLKSWLGQSTTGTGFAALFACLGGVAGSAISWHQAIPLLVGGLAGLIWPENPRIKSAAEDAAGSIEKLVTAYRIGVQHGVGSPAGPAQIGTHAAAQNSVSPGAGA